MGLVSAASAAEKLKAKPWIYDPDNLGDVVSAWVNKIGLPDHPEHQNKNGKDKGPTHGLWLTKDAGTAANEASGASIKFQGTLTELGFDFRNGSHDGAGAPRFNVYTTSPTHVYYFYGSASGAHSPVPDESGWTRVRFVAADGFPSDGASFITNFNQITVTSIEIVFDEGTDQGTGFALLDNIDVNGDLITGP
jgi:hypothetical protein